MGDMAEYFQSMRDYNKERRASNTESSTDLLRRNRVTFQSRNAGAHLVVWAGNWDVDFWPSTGLWIVRATKKRNRGVKKLIEFVKQQSR